MGDTDVRIRFTPKPAIIDGRAEQIPAFPASDRPPPSPSRAQVVCKTTAGCTAGAAQDYRNPNYPSTFNTG